jgi:hypothetical protein
MVGSVAPWVKASVRGMSPAERVDVYREQFWIRHLANLREDFPTLTWALGGEEPFRLCATDYLDARPPCTWNLQRLGEGIPEFVADDPRWRGDQLVQDAARLDWAFMEAFDAADAPAFDPRLLASTPEDAWPEIGIALHPSVRLLAAGHRVAELRDAVKRGETPDRPGPHESHVVVWRDGACFLRAAAIECAAWHVLSALHAGHALGAACERASVPAEQADLEQIGTKLAGWFGQWTASGWIASLRLPEALTGPSHGDRRGDGS